MSLINDALKKAQRQRTEGSPADAAPVPGGAPVTKRAEPRSANTVVLIASGALVLVVLSVVATVFLVNRPKPQPLVAKTSAPSAASANKAAVPAESATPALVPPNITPPAPKPASETASEAAPTVAAAPTPLPSKPEVKETSKTDRVVETKAAPRESGTPPANSASTPATASPTPTPAAPAPTPAAKGAGSPSSAAQPPPSTPSPTPTASTSPATTAAAAPSKPDERIVAFVENVKVAGIRSSGNESRVLMNDRVYRVNDIVDRTLGVRLIKVAVDSLTFADANGVTYVKYF